jgi:mRNA-degrading endonuclease toxin of MazEF toxin-antitoxin module
LPERPNPSKERGAVWTLKREAYERLGIPVKERRPWIIVQSDDFGLHGTRMACPFTSCFRKDESGQRTDETKEPRDTQVSVIWKAREPSLISCDDIYTIKVREFDHFFGLLTDLLPLIDEKLKLALGLK